MVTFLNSILKSVIHIVVSNIVTSCLSIRLEKVLICTASKAHLHCK